MECLFLDARELKDTEEKKHNFRYMTGMNCNIVTESGEALNNMEICLVSTLSEHDQYHTYRHQQCAQAIFITDRNHLHHMNKPSFHSDNLEY